MAVTEDEIFNSATQYISHIIDNDRLSIYLVQPGGKELKHVFSVGEVVVPIGTVMNLDGTWVGQAVQTGRLIAAANIEKIDAVYAQYRQMSIQSGFQSLMIATIRVPQQLIW